MVDGSVAAAIESDLLSMPDDIEKKAEAKNKALEEYRRAEADLENERAKIIQTEKAKVIAETAEALEQIIKLPRAEASARMKMLKMHQPTIEDLKAIATQETYQKALDVIKKESDYKAKEKEFYRARNDFDALKERSYNYRQELKAIGG